MVSATVKMFSLKMLSENDFFFSIRVFHRQYHPEMEIMASKDLTAVKKVTSSGIDLMITGSRDSYWFKSNNVVVLY